MFVAKHSLIIVFLIQYLKQGAESEPTWGPALAENREGSRYEQKNLAPSSAENKGPEAAYYDNTQL